MQQPSPTLNDKSEVKEQMQATSLIQKDKPVEITCDMYRGTTPSSDNNKSTKLRAELPVILGIALIAPISNPG